MELKFRVLRASEIECRVAMCSEKGVSILLYKDARVDQIILDETVGPMNWTKSYDLIDGQLFCTVSIWDDDKKIWVSKQDVGVESNTEAEKGRASDAQKRAAFCWGIGRALYTAPFIWVDYDRCTIKEGRNGKAVCYDRFRVTDYVEEDGVIVALRIINESHRGEEVFRFGKLTESAQKIVKLEKTETKAEAPVEPMLTAEDREKLLEIGTKLGVTEEQMLAKVGVSDWALVTARQGRMICAALKAKEQMMVRAKEKQGAKNG